MTTLNDFTYTDNVHDVMAEYVNKLLAAALRAEYRNVETLSANRQLLDVDTPFQLLTASGADRDVKLAAEATTNHVSILCNNGASNDLVVKDDSGATTFTTLAPGEWCLALSNGTAWKVIRLEIPAPATGGGGSNSICDGRLSLASGTPVTTTDQTAKTTVYFVSYVGNKIALYNGSTWDVVDIGTPSVAVPSTTSTPFDIYCYNNAGTPTLETVNWTNDTARATALAYQDGVLVKSGDATRRYLGTGRTTTVSGQCESSTTRRYLWNYYNRVLQHMFCKDDTNSWTYTTATIRPSNNNTTDGVGRVACVIGVAEDLTKAIPYDVAYNASSAAVMNGVGIDSTTVSSCLTFGRALTAGAVGVVTALYLGILSAGYHYIQHLEYSQASGTTTWYGDDGGTVRQSGMTVEVMG